MFIGLIERFTLEPLSTTMQTKRSRRSPAQAVRPALSGWLLIGLLGFSIAVGSGGVPSVAAEGLTILASLAVLATLVVLPKGLDRPLPRLAWLALLPLPLLIVVQLVPLPASVWTGLPLRDPLAASLRSVGSQLPAWPLSIDPASTWWSLLSLAPPVAAFVMAFTLGREKLPAVLLAVAALALASGLLEAAQAILGDMFFIHPRSIDAGPSGFFANQNSQATFLVIGLLSLITLAAFDARARRSLPAVIAAGLFLVVCVVMTRSRAGSALLLVPLCLIGAIALARAQDKRKWAIGTAIAAAALPVLTFAALQIEQVNKVADRFSDLSTGRAEEIWPDAIYLMQESWPWGMGVGTFPHAFELVERLEVVTETSANRAHVDWIEFVIGAGLPGVLLLLLGTAAIAWSVWTKRKSFGPGEVFASGVVMVIALHSAVDYPLRAISLAVLASIAMALLTSNETKLEKQT